MSELRVAKRYAQALLEQADAQGVLDAVQRDIKMVLEVFAESRQLLIITESPDVRLEKKRTIYEQIFQGKIQELSLRFIHLMISKRREELLKPTFEEFEHAYNRLKGISKATLITAQPVSEATVAKLRERVAAATRTQVEMSTSEDASLIGGFMLRYGDHMVDASVKHYLRQVQKSLVNNR